MPIPYHSRLSVKEKAFRDAGLAQLEEHVALELGVMSSRSTLRVEIA